MEKFVNLFRVELYRSARDISSRRVSFVIGILFMLGLYFGLQRFPWLAFLGSNNHGGAGLWVYFAWILVLSGTLEICTGLCADISSGVVSKIAQAPVGLRAILRARFAVSWLITTLTVLVLFFGICLLDGTAHRPEASLAIIYLALTLQTYSVMLVLAGATVTRKSMGSAYGIGLLIVAPLTFVPAEALLKNAVVFFPLSGPLALLKHHQAYFWGPELSLVISFFYLVVGRSIFNVLIRRLKDNGALLFV